MQNGENLFLLIACLDWKAETSGKAGPTVAEIDAPYIMRLTVL
jgi:hypothetical protein